jgi:hypothetical protein
LTPAERNGSGASLACAVSQILKVCARLLSCPGAGNHIWRNRCVKLRLTSSFCGWFLKVTS